MLYHNLQTMYIKQEINARNQKYLCRYLWGVTYPALPAMSVTFKSDSGNQGVYTSYSWRLNGEKCKTKLCNSIVLW